MRYFIDTEFLDLGAKHPVHLISIGIVAEDGREYYAEWEDAPLHLADAWVKENVVPYLHRSHARHRYAIAKQVLDFISVSEKPSFWGYFADYDWVVFCQIFGKMIDLPRTWPQYCKDVRQAAAMLGNPKLPDKPANRHNALYDARWTRDAYDFLNGIWQPKMGAVL